MNHIKYAPWVGWNGGKCPVDENDNVEVSTNAGLWVGPARDISWGHGGSCPVYAYRVEIKPATRYAIGRWHEWHGRVAIRGGVGTTKHLDKRPFKITVTGDDISVEWLE